MVEESDEQLQIQERKSWLLKSLRAWLRDMGLALQGCCCQDVELVEVDPELPSDLLCRVKLSVTL